MAGQTRTGLVEWCAGASWQAAAGRAGGVFLLGYVGVPLMLGRTVQGVGFAQFFSSAAFFVLATLALFRLLRHQADSTDEELPLRAPLPAAVPATPWTPAVLRGLAPNRLDMLVATYYREKGIRVDACPQRTWNGIMLRLFQDDGDEPTSLVRCKACTGQPVERRQIEELVHAMVECATPKAFFVAPDGFSDEAFRLARSAHITALDGPLLLEMLNRLPEGARARLHALVQTAAAKEPANPGPG